MEYGIKPETPEENAIELERMRDLAEKTIRTSTVYSGKTNDIDLHLTWYCPHCFNQLSIGRMVVQYGCAVAEIYKKSKTDTVYEVLSCPSNFEICDYEFSNKDLRRMTSSFWGELYQYPLNPIQLHQIRIEQTEGAITASTKAIELHKANIAEQQERLIELKSKTFEVQTSMYNE